MGLVGSGTNNARLAQMLRQLALFYQKDANALMMVRIAQGTGQKLYFEVLNYVKNVSSR
jgi:hypothetical protein